MSSEEVYVIAKYDYNAQDKQELQIKKNEKLVLLDDSKQWWKVENSQRQSGFVPSNFVKKCKPSILTSLINTLGRLKTSTGTSQSASSAGGSGVPSAQRGPDSVSESSVGSDTYANEITSASVCTIVRYPYEARQSDELPLSKGERVFVLEKSSDGWWRGKKETGEVGWFPSNYMELSDGNRGSETYALAETTNYYTGGSLLTRADRAVIETVATLYPFTSTNHEELSFDKDERLEILEKPIVDPEWWRARNARGEVGLVPRNYVQTLSTDSGFPQTTPESFSSSSLSGNSHSGSGKALSSRTPSGSSAAGGSRGGVTVWQDNSRVVPLGRGSVVPPSVAEVSGAYSSRDWFFSNMSRLDCEHMLNSSADNGDFIVRESETNVSVSSHPPRLHASSVPLFKIKFAFFFISIVRPIFRHC